MYNIYEKKQDSTYKYNTKKRGEKERRVGGEKMGRLKDEVLLTFIGKWVVDMVRNLYVN